MKFNVILLIFEAFPLHFIIRSDRRHQCRFIFPQYTKSFTGRICLQNTTPDTFRFVERKVDSAKKHESASGVSKRGFTCSWKKRSAAVKLNFPLFLVDTYLLAMRPPPFFALSFLLCNICTQYCATEIE
jgi:hypothetical protein